MVPFLGQIIEVDPHILQCEPALEGIVQHKDILVRRIHGGQNIEVGGKPYLSLHKQLFKTRIPGKKGRDIVVGHRVFGFAAALVTSTISTNSI